MISLIGPGPRRIAVVGSRHYPDLERVRAFVHALPLGTTLVTGGASGVDAEVRSEAEGRGLVVQRLAPTLEEGLDPSRGAERNRRLLERVDAVVAFWDGSSTGTRLTLDRALEMGRELHVFVHRPEIGTGTPGISGGPGRA